MEKLNFDAAVEVLPHAEPPQYRGEIGRIKGIQEENGMVYGYAVKLQKIARLICFSHHEIKEITDSKDHP